MILSLICYVIFSVVIVVCFHFLYKFGIDNFTTKKIKYLGQFHNQKYQEIIDELRKHTSNIAVNHQNAAHLPFFGVDSIFPNNEFESKEKNGNFQDTNTYISDLEKTQLEESLMNFAKTLE